MASLSNVAADREIETTSSEAGGKIAEPNWIVRFLLSDKILLFGGIVIGIVSIVQLGVIYFTSFRF